MYSPHTQVIPSSDKVSIIYHKNLQQKKDAKGLPTFVIILSLFWRVLPEPPQGCKGATLFPAGQRWEQMLLVMWVQSDASLHAWTQCSGADSACFRPTLVCIRLGCVRM